MSRIDSGGKELSAKDLRDRYWELAVTDSKVSVFQHRSPWAAWVPVLLVLFYAINTYRVMTTTDHVENSLLASIIWALILLVPAGIVFWLWGMNRRRTVVRLMNRRDTPDGASITLRDNHAGRHDYLVEPEEADRIARIIADSQAK